MIFFLFEAMFLTHLELTKSLGVPRSGIISICYLPCLDIFLNEGLGIQLKSSHFHKKYFTEWAVSPSSHQLQKNRVRDSISGLSHGGCEGWGFLIPVCSEALQKIIGEKVLSQGIQWSSDQFIHLFTLYIKAVCGTDVGTEDRKTRSQM